MIQIANEGDLGGARGPLVTYRVQCYQHEAFVREALNSVLAQTYRPLEVLITDDASPDQTFEIAREAALQYRGPHRVVLYRGERNRDILAHWNDALHLMRGDLFLSLAGDDVAEPDQIEQLAAAWLRGGASAVWSNYRVIDEHSRDLGIGLPAGHPYTLDLCDYADGRFLDFPYGGLGLFSREVIDRFGEVPAQLGARGLEHHPAFRAALLGPKHYLDKPLARKRNHPNRRTNGHNVRDRALDPMMVHERQIRVRLQILTGCRDVVPREPSYATLVQALGEQIATEVRRLLEFEAFRERARRLAEAGSPAPMHSGWEYPPNEIRFVRGVPEHRCNIIAGECMYFAVPWSTAKPEACGLRNHRYPGVLRAWTETELLDMLKR